MSVARTLGELRQSSFSEQRLASRRVKDELRENLMARLRNQGDSPIFPGIVGYDDTVVPQIVNAILSRHNFILLGLRGQAKSRILRALTALLDEHAPFVAGCEIQGACGDVLDAEARPVEDLSLPVKTRQKELGLVSLLLVV